MGIKDLINERENEFINARDAVEFIAKAESCSVGEVINFMRTYEIKYNLPIYLKSNDYLIPYNDLKKDDRGDEYYQTTEKFLISVKDSLDVLGGFHCKYGEDYFFKLTELFNSSKLSELNLEPKYHKMKALADARDEGFLYIAQKSLGRFRSGDYVTGITKDKMESFVRQGVVKKVDVVNLDDDYKFGYDEQRIFINQLSQQSKSLTTSLNDLEIENTRLHNRIKELESLLKQSQSSHADETLHPRTANNASKIISALASELLGLDITKPYADETNGKIKSAIEKQGNTLSKDVIAYWLKLAHEQSK